MYDNKSVWTIYVLLKHATHFKKSSVRYKLAEWSVLLNHTNSLFLYRYQAAKRESATLTVENEELSQALTTLQSQM